MLDCAVGPTFECFYVAWERQFWLQEQSAMARSGARYFMKEVCSGKFDVNAE